MCWQVGNIGNRKRESKRDATSNAPVLPGLKGFKSTTCGFPHVAGGIPLEKLFYAGFRRLVVGVEGGGSNSGLTVR
jgi:hypothetical protein